MAINRRSFIKGLSAAMAAIIPMSTNKMSAKEFEAVEPKLEDEPSDMVFKDNRWQHPDSYESVNSGSGNIMPMGFDLDPSTYIHACSGTIPTAKKRYRIPACSG